MQKDFSFTLSLNKSITANINIEQKLCTETKAKAWPTKC